MYKVLIITTDYTESGVIPASLLKEQICYLEDFGIIVKLLIDPSQEELEEILKETYFDVVYSTTRNSYITKNGQRYPSEYEIFKILEYYNTNFIGSGYTEQLISNDKLLSGQKSGIAINNSIITRRMYTKKEVDFNKLVQNLHFPLIIKPNSLSGSLGIDKNSVVFDTRFLSEKIGYLFERFTYLNEIILEEYLESASEYTVSVIGNSDSLSCSVTRLDYYDKSNIHIYSEFDEQSNLKDRCLKYSTESNTSIKNELIFHAKRLFQICNLRDFARFDILYDKRAYLIEINSLPVLGNSFSWEWQNELNINNRCMLALLIVAYHYRKVSTGRPDNLPKELIQSIPYQILKNISHPLILKNVPESSIPSDYCPKTRLYTMVDRISAETEVLIFLKALVILLKPDLILETGTYMGATTFAMAEGLSLNKNGHIISIEIDSELAQNISEKSTGYPITIINSSSLEYFPESKIDILFLDSTRKLRKDEFWHFKKFLHNNSIIIWHDSSPEHECVFKGVEELYEAGIIDRLLLPTPRGLTIAMLKR